MFELLGIIMQREWHLLVYRCSMCDYSSHWSPVHYIIQSCNEYSSSHKCFVFNNYAFQLLLLSQSICCPVTGHFHMFYIWFVSKPLVLSNDKIRTSKTCICCFHFKKTNMYFHTKAWTPLQCVEMSECLLGSTRVPEQEASGNMSACCPPLSPI